MANCDDSCDTCALGDNSANGCLTCNFGYKLKEGVGTNKGECELDELLIAGGIFTSFSTTCCSCICCSILLLLIIVLTTKKNKYS